MRRHWLDLVGIPPHWLVRHPDMWGDPMPTNRHRLLHTVTNPQTVVKSPTLRLYHGCFAKQKARVNTPSAYATQRCALGCLRAVRPIAPFCWLVKLCIIMHAPACLCKPRASRTCTGGGAWGGTPVNRLMILLVCVQSRQFFYWGYPHGVYNGSP